MKCPNCDHEPMYETELRDMFAQKTDRVVYDCPKCGATETRSYEQPSR